MARKTLTQELAELREYTAKLEIELAGLREMVKSNRRPRSQFKSLVEEGARYCKEHGVKSVSRPVLQAWLAGQ